MIRLFRSISSVKRWVSGPFHSETGVLAVYETTVKPYHTEVKLKRSGLLVNETCPYICAYPDSVRSCGCQDEILIEVKCPYSLMGQEPKKKIGDSNFCIDRDGHFKEWPQVLLTK